MPPPHVPPPTGRLSGDWYPDDTAGTPEPPFEPDEYSGRLPDPVTGEIAGPVSEEFGGAYAATPGFATGGYPGAPGLPPVPAAALTASPAGALPYAGGLGAPTTGQPHLEPALTPMHRILVSTMNDLPGYEVIAVYGEVFGLVVRSRNLFSNVGASFRTIFGGEARGYTALLSTTRLEAVDRLRTEAASHGANAVLGMRFDTGVFANVMNEVAAYGTAVTVRPLGV